MNEQKGLLTHELKAEIDAMSQVEMARHVRFDPSGSKYFIDQTGDYFTKVFSQKGGMTSEISKLIGW
jgi:hypothetical protein